MADTAVHPEIEALIRSVLIGSPVAAALGVELAVIEVDRVVLRLPFKVDNITVGSIVHGGVIATLIDTAAAVASFSGMLPDTKGGATSSLTVTYLAPADAADLTAEAVVVRRGRRQSVEDVAVRDATGTLIAKALVTSQIF